ncbi:MAG: (2Fe-2S)-binding protein [Actinomycetota bacterium]|nr:(2Fe-2S)-binding protein [Actinomycetota bacterium]
MLVCHCRAVNDRRILDEIARGARDEFDVAAACGAGSECGGCVPAITRLLAACRECPARTLLDAVTTRP